MINDKDPKKAQEFDEMQETGRKIAAIAHRDMPNTEFERAITTGADYLARVMREIYAEQDAKTQEKIAYLEATNHNLDAALNNLHVYLDEGFGSMPSGAIRELMVAAKEVHPLGAYAARINTICDEVTRWIDVWEVRDHTEPEQ